MKESGVDQVASDDEDDGNKRKGNPMKSQVKKLRTFKEDIQALFAKSLAQVSSDQTFQIKETPSEKTSKKKNESKPEIEAKPKEAAKTLEKPTITKTAEVNIAGTNFPIFGLRNIGNTCFFNSVMQVISF